MLNFQVCICFALLVVVFGNPEVTQFDTLRCDQFTPVVITSEQANGEWIGVDMVKNIGVGKHHVDTKKTCLYGEAKSLGNNRFTIDQKMLEGVAAFDHGNNFFSYLNSTTGVMSLEAAPDKTLRVIAMKDNNYIAVVFCDPPGALTFNPITKIVTYRRPGTPDFTPKEEKDFHDEIQNKLGVHTLVFGKQHCRHHGKN